MTRRIVSTPGQSAPVAINLPMKTTDLNAPQTAQVSGGRFYDEDMSEFFDQEIDPFEELNEIYLSLSLSISLCLYDFFR